ncbi:MAG: exodeoxyribonuclease VII small subunit [Deltaproteobacteria bacterium]|nr:exodeoxyribonuclease VII small subunit [Deltaproteobacteria bacterium]
MGTKKTTEVTRSFEESVKELELVVRSLEGGELTLDESLAAFERGIGIARECEKSLTAAKGKVEQLVRTASGGLTAVPFEPKDQPSS